jgi:hypothetical protein
MNINSRQQKNINEAILSVPRNNNEELNEIASTLARFGIKGLSKLFGKSAQKGAQKGAGKAYNPSYGKKPTAKAAKAAADATGRKNVRVIPRGPTMVPRDITGVKFAPGVTRKMASDPAFKKKIGQKIKKEFDRRGWKPGPGAPSAATSAPKAAASAPKAAASAPKASAAASKATPKAGSKTTASAVDPNKPQMRTVGSKVDGVKTVGPGRKAEKARAAARPSGVEPPVKPKMTAGQQRRDIQRQHGDIRRARRQGKMGAISAAAKRYKLRRKTSVDPLGVIPSRREFKTGLKYLKRKTGSVTGGISTNPLVTGGLGYYLGRGSGDE